MKYMISLLTILSITLSHASLWEPGQQEGLYKRLCGGNTVFSEAEEAVVQAALSILSRDTLLGDAQALIDLARQHQALAGDNLAQWFDTVIQIYLQSSPGIGGDHTTARDTLSFIFEQTGPYRKGAKFHASTEWWMMQIGVLYRICDGEPESISESFDWAGKFVKDGMTDQTLGQICTGVATFVMDTEKGTDLNGTALGHALSQAAYWQPGEVVQQLTLQLTVGEKIKF